jgi:hypothetical protein
MDCADFPKNLQRALIVRGYSRPLFARKLGCDTVNRWLNGERGPDGSRYSYRDIENVLEVTGICLPHEQFLAANQMDFNYPFMKYFRLYESNEFSESGEFENFIDASLDSVQHSVCYTHLCDTPQRSNVHFIPRELRYAPFLDRLRKKEVEFHRIEVFFKVQQLVYALKSLIDFRGTRYECRFYLKPPVSFPVVNIRSFDHRIFVLGGFEPRAVYAPNCILLEGKEPMGSFLGQYWDAVWSKGNPLELNFETAVAVALSLGLNSEEWQKIWEEHAPKPHPGQ